MPRILSVSLETRQRITRDDILAAAGFSVISPKTPDEASLLVKQEPVDVVVICQSVEPEDRKRIIQAIRRTCHCPIVFVSVGLEPPQEEALADVSIDVTKGTEALLIALQELLSKKDMIA